MDFSDLFHDASKDPTGGGTVRIPRDMADWPEEWREPSHKRYERTPHIALPEDAVPGDLAPLIERRVSARGYGAEPLSLPQLAALLRYSCGVMGGSGETERRAQPSAGRRFPLEAYYLSFQPSRELPSGIYHYAVVEHALDCLEARVFSAADIEAIYTQPWVAKSSGMIVLTAVFERTEGKYGARGYRYALIEAGHVGQNLYLAATALGIGCRAVGGTDDTFIEHLLDIDGVSESVVYSLTIGVPRAGEMGTS